jgi:light-regulated signal transduction histidine kinase (bacteriophytochrome)
VARWFGTATDITGQRRTEEQLRRANRELEEFAYVASHDLQEPLRMVSIYTHLMLRGAESDPAFSQYGEFIRQGVSRMETLVNDLLTFSRTVHTVEEPAGTVDLSAALAEAVSVLQSRINESRAVIVAEALPRVRGQTNQLAHVFQNLLSNSLKYRHPDRPPEIRISAMNDCERAVISVRDNGIGFDQKHATRIFGLFKRLHRDEYPGTGLGLAICQRIVERYGGRIWAEGTPGEGATFYLSLPGAEDN